VATPSENKPDPVVLPVDLLDGFSGHALEFLLNAVKENEAKREKEKMEEQDLYSGSTNLRSVLERGEEYEAD